MDRNTENAVLFLMTTGSLSARRAWIEIARVAGLALLPDVALRKESVDRNARASSLAIRSCGRSPQGERG